MPLSPANGMPTRARVPQVELGSVAAGTVVTFDDVEVWNGLPGSPGTTPPPPPPPPPPGGGSGILLATVSDNFNGPTPYKLTVAAFAGAAASVSYAGAPTQRKSCSRM